MNLNKIYNSFSEKELSHSLHVEKLAVLLFEKTKNIFHNLGEKEKNFLKYASKYHDIGRVVSSEEHALHSYEIIMQSNDEDFSKYEREIIAYIAKFHASKPLKNLDKYIEGLDKYQRKVVKILSPILRIADFLDREHLEIIKNFDIEYDRKNCIFYILLNSIQTDYFPDIKIFSRKKLLFETEFNVQLVLKNNVI